MRREDRGWIFWLARAAGRFGGNRSGGVAVTTALLTLPLTVAALGVIDYSRASDVKSALQDSLDSATLAVGRSNLTDAAQIQALGANVLAANLRSFASTQLTQSTFTLINGQIVSTAQAKVQAIAMDSLLGHDMTVSANSTVQRSTHKLEIALVLDNTGSMAGSKLSTLKSAASSFVDDMSAAAARSTETDVVKIGVAPFSMTVNVGSAYKTADWIDGHLDANGNPTTALSPVHQEIFTSTANRFQLLKQMNVAWGGCVESRPAPYDVQDTAPDPSTPSTLFVPFFAPDEPDSSGYYNNYLTDVSGSSGWSAKQGNPAKYTKSPKSGTNSVGYAYGPNSGCALAPIQRLTTDLATVKSGLSAMTAIGDTNIPLGLEWGWHLLSPLAPFADGTPYNTEGVEKVIILMTDGQNSNAVTSNSDASIYSGIGYIWQNRLGITSGTSSQRQTALDNRLTTLCTNIKAKNITIYTVRVEVNDSNYGVLQGCASSKDKFYDVSSVSQLTAVFDTIAGSIQKLRLSR